MEYKGKLYGKVGKSYFDTGSTSDDFDKLKMNNTQANEFIIDIAELLDMNTNGIGYDELQFTIEDFEEKIKEIKNR